MAPEYSYANPSTDQRRADAAVALARQLLTTSEADIARSEARQRARMHQLISDSDGRDLLFALTDEVLRHTNDASAAARFAALVDTYDLRALSPIDRNLMRIGAKMAPLFPRLVMPLVRQRIMAETRGVVVSADDPAFARHVAARTEQGVRLNINPLGEAILSDAEADHRLQITLDRIARADVDYVSLKISAVVANLSPLAFDQGVELICERLRTIYRAAQAAHPVTFINLDMEEYKDLELSIASFTKVLDEPEFAAIDAGIVLQAYLPDTHAALERLGAWATDRHERSGGTIKVRIVKGANLAMESVDAELHGWVPAPYPDKAAVDASYKAMLDAALRPEWADALRVGVASHNLFDIAWALIVTEEAAAGNRVEFEMLEGMAPAQARAVETQADGLLMYAPVVARDDFAASIAYLSRRLDENTQPDNFLRALFDLSPDSPEWDEQEARFRASVAARHTVFPGRRRTPLSAAEGFSNAPDTDFTDPDARQQLTTAQAPSARYTLIAAHTEIDNIVAAANNAARRWHGLSPRERTAQLSQVATLMAAERATTVALIGDETGKSIPQADPEVSEAIDFANYYAGPARQLLDDVAGEGCNVAGRGVVSVLGPWNFPYAIPFGGVLAALAAGNAAILKPAPEARRIGAHIVDQCHRAGLPHDLVQLVVCEDGPVGKHLVTHADIDTTILTGATDTADLFRSWKPDLRLFAETSGKNALIITEAADLDLAIADLVSSAFGHAGQKCSAASLGIITANVYDDPSFQERLRQVVHSWVTDWPQNLGSMVGPVIAPPTGKLERALTQLDSGESWLVTPRQLDDTGRLWSPGVRIGVRKGSWFHQTECFGPVLGLIRVETLDEAIEVQNDSSYGLTGGIHSLDPREVAIWKDRVQVGNAYVNRAITGAIVQRQPFGGWKGSSVGPGTKAGGPNYLLQLADISDEHTHVRTGASTHVIASYTRAWEQHFTQEHDPSGLASESNVLRYIPVRRVVVRHDGTTPDALERIRLAATLTGVHLVESDRRDVGCTYFLAGLHQQDRVRFLYEPNSDERLDLNPRGIWYDTAPPSAHGRVELIKWVKEQAISTTLHRHGRLPSA